MTEKPGRTPSSNTKRRKKGVFSFAQTRKDPRFGTVEHAQPTTQFREKSNKNQERGIDHRFQQHLNHLESPTRSQTKNLFSSGDEIENKTTLSAKCTDHLYLPEASLAREENLIPFTNRLALVDFALWECVVAADLHVLFSSFTPLEGEILGVSIYMSDLGKANNLGGVLPDLWNPLNKKAAKLESASDLDREKVKHYKNLRRRFYYAILDFDNSETAEEVFNRCNGIEVEFTKHPITLEVVPTETVFNESDAYDTSTEYPLLYTMPPILSLLSSRVKSKMDKGSTSEIPKLRGSEYEKFEEGQAIDMEISSSSEEDIHEIDGLWDTTDPKRSAALNCAFSAVDDMNMADLDAYVASDSGEYASERDSIRGRYTKLLEDLSDGEEKKITENIDDLSQLFNQQINESQAYSGDEVREFTAEFTDSQVNEKMREGLHRKIMLEKALLDAPSIAEKIKIKRKIKKKERKGKFQEQNDEENLPTKSSESTTNELLETVKENVYFSASSEPAMEVPADDEDSQHNTTSLSVKEKRKLQKKKKQLASQSDRNNRKNLRLRHAKGVDFVDTYTAATGSARSKRKVMEDERFADRLNSQSDFHVDVAHQMRKA